MDQRLYSATIQGNTKSLLKLIQEDPLILHRNNTTSFLETPLHIAAMLGHQQFAVELLKQKPELTREPDSQKSMPLHLASAKGYLDIVKACLTISPEVCFAYDRDGKNPVHVAAIRGKIDVLKELLRVKPEAGRAIVDRDKRTILHLCVEYGQFEALKFLIEFGNLKDLINLKDKNGNTILHLAVADKQVETTDYLLAIAGIELNALNLSGMTPMDILVQRGPDVRDIEIQDSLARSGAYDVRENINYSSLSIHRDDLLVSSMNLRNGKKKKPIKQNTGWLEQKRNALMVVASLIATMAFQVGVNPPSEVLQNNNTNDSNSSYDPSDLRYYINVVYSYLKRFAQFYMINTVSFIASLSIILLLMSGLSIKNKFFMWSFMVITWIAITALALSYTVSVIILTPPSEKRSVDNLIGITVFAWLCLMALLLIAHTVRLIFKVFKMLVKILKAMIKPFMRRRRIRTTHVNV